MRAHYYGKEETRLVQTIIFRSATGVPSNFKDAERKDFVTFKEERPRIVRGGYSKMTAVINVSYQGELRSLYVGSNVDLARQIWNIWKERNRSLKGWTVSITKTEKVGRNWRYKVE